MSGKEKLGLEKPKKFTRYRMTLKVLTDFNHYEKTF